MTKEMAIHNLYALKQRTRALSNHEALDLAIKALEQQPSEDCISREQAIRATYGFERYTGIDEAPYEYAESILRDLPPVTSQPKIGRWIIIDDCEQFIAKCSECGQIEDSRMISKYPYCHCGAKMEVEE